MFVISVDDKNCSVASSSDKVSLICIRQENNLTASDACQPFLCFHADKDVEVLTVRSLSAFFIVFSL